MALQVIKPISEGEKFLILGRRNLMNFKKIGTAVLTKSDYGYEIDTKLESLDIEVYTRKLDKNLV
ncbi:hypothetical protein [Pediococcus ethanolidurans]|uniref:hypothetical protein n=1 Tax=Pediococcus ethanolidurans TaxID=319653 RepID=UPI002953E22F|nr:hypothetical protein [Pediococcus ethanolidurans]